MLLMLVNVVKTPDPSLALALCKHRFGLHVKAVTWGTEAGGFEDHIGGENGESWGR